MVKALAGEEHIVVQTKDKDGKKAMYGMWLGDQDTKTENYTKVFGAAPKTTEMDMLELNVENDRVEDFACLKAGTVYIYLTPAKAKESIIPDKPAATGMIYFYKAGGSWKFVTEDEYEAKKASLPDVCFATDQFINKFSEASFPDLSSLRLEPGQDYNSDVPADVKESLSF